MDRQDERDVSAGHGIAIERTFLPDAFDAPAVRWRIRSDRDDSVAVRLEKTFPADFDVERIGFESDVGADGWSIDGRALAFESDLEPREEVTAVYTVDSEEAFDAVGDEPELREVEPLEADPVVDRIERSGETTELIADAGSDDDGEVATDEAITTDEAKATDSDRIEDEPGVGGGVTADDEPLVDEAVAEREGDAGADVSAVSTDRLVEELVSRIESGELPDSAEETLASSLDVPREDESLEARLDHLQKRMSDFEAYAASLSTIYEEQGPPDEVLRDVQERLDAIESTVTDDSERIDELEAELESIADEVADVGENVELVADGVDDLERDVDGIVADVDELEETVASIRARVADLSDVESELDSVTEELDRLETWQENINSFFETFDPQPDEP